MILLFGEKAHKSSKSSNIKNSPVENSGILARHTNNVNSLLDANEYDMYVFSQQAEIDYSQYSSGAPISVAFMGEFSDAISILSADSDSSYASCGSDIGFSCCSSSDCGSFSSMC